jgi:hypothetical protein
MTAAKKTQTLAEAIAEIQAWQGNEQDKQHGALVSIERDEQELLNQINAMRHRLEGTKKAREEVRQNLDRLPEAAFRRAHLVLAERLPAERTALAERAEILRKADEAAKATARVELEDPEVQAALSELEGFKEIEATLATLPPSYREAILSHHEQVKAKLAPVLARAKPSPARFDGAPLTVSVVGSVDVNDGEVTAFALLLPVSDKAYSDWTAQPEDAAYGLACRVVGVVAQLLKQLNAENAPVMYRGFFDCLMIQVWLADHHITEDLPVELEKLLAIETGRAAELDRAAVSVSPVWVAPFAIAPPEEGAIPDLTDERPHVQAVD